MAFKVAYCDLTVYGDCLDMDVLKYSFAVLMDGITFHAVNDVPKKGDADFVIVITNDITANSHVLFWRDLKASGIPAFIVTKKDCGTRGRQVIKDLGMDHPVTSPSSMYEVSVYNRITSTITKAAMRTRQSALIDTCGIPHPSSWQILRGSRNYFVKLEGGKVVEVLEFKFVN